MAKRIQDILAPANMVGVIQGVKPGIPNPWDPAFMTNVAPTIGDDGTYVKVDAARDTARLVAYGGASLRKMPKGCSRVGVKLIHTFEHIFHNPNLIDRLTSAQGGMQEIASQEVDRQTAEFKAGFDNLRIAAVGMALAKGVIYFDGAGNLLESSSGAMVSVDFGIPAGNKNQLNVLGAGDIITASWATAGTDIVGQLSALKIAALKKTGYPLTTIYYGEAIPGYLAANTSIKALLQGNVAFAQSFLGNEIPDGLCGFKWRKAGQGFYVDQNGDVREIVASDAAIFTPDVDRSWYEMLEGTYRVPTNFGSAVADPVAAMANTTMVRGPFSYCILESDPPAIKHLAGDTFLPVIKVPGAIFIADVAF